MRSIGALLWFVACLLLAGLAAAQAQSIKVTPANGSVAVGKALQYSAAVTGLASTDVKWSAGGVVGGNATVGTISASGMYMAPASLPGQNPVQIVASSVASPKVSGLTYVNILAAGPTITAVSPNPLSTGTITVTISGSGFAAGATAFDSYGSNSRIQLTTLSVSPNTITATGYQ